MPAKPFKYVIHKHKATHLHYDVRLERDGVLKSWAVPKQPPQEPGIKRLAIQVEDHPLGYETFEGAIPEGEYGAGEVSIWDKGTYAPITYTADEIVVDFKGTKLSGPYYFIRLSRQQGKKPQWLFFKRKGIATT